MKYKIIIGVVLVLVVVGFLFLSKDSVSNDVTLTDVDGMVLDGGIAESENLYLQAQKHLEEGNLEEAKEALLESLEIESDHTESIFLLAQIEADTGNLEEAIKLTDRALRLDSSSVGILFQLGVLKYQGEDYNGAIDALGRALEINVSYSDARYFKGLSHDMLGQRDLALIEFELIQQLNPDIQEVTIIIENLNAGRGALESL